MSRPIRQIFDPKIQTSKLTYRIHKYRNRQDIGIYYISIPKEFVYTMNLNINDRIKMVITDDKKHLVLSKQINE